jgi:hypothetical protein
MVVETGLYIDSATLGVLYTTWIAFFWGMYILLSRKLRLSFGYLLFALVAQLVHWIGLYFSLRRNAKVEPMLN